MEHPLAVYVFSTDKEFQRKVFENTESGSAIVNETVISCGVPQGLPMGGVGASGYGYYTGKHMFDEFTHLRVSIDNPGWVDKLAFGFRYPPYKQANAAPFSLTPSAAGEEPWVVGEWEEVRVLVLAGVMSIVLTASVRGLLKQLKD